MATTGTHDTEPLATWWAMRRRRSAPPPLALPLVRERLGERRRAACARLTGAIRAALLEAVYASRSELVILPVQDVFGWPDRINTPAVGGRLNWTWRLPWEVEQMSREPVAVEVAAMLRDLATRHGR